MSDGLQKLIDREEIRDLMARYARGVDRDDWDLVREVYHPDAHDDHGDYKGGVDGFIEFGRSRTGGATQCMHFLGNCLISFARKDVAVVETYFFTAHTLGPKAQKEYGTATGGSVQLSSYGRYADRVERRNNGPWRIAKRIVIFEANRVATNEVPPIKADWAHHKRDKSDPIYGMLKDAGLPTK